MGWGEGGQIKVHLAPELKYLIVIGCSIALLQLEACIIITIKWALASCSAMTGHITCMLVRFYPLGKGITHSLASGAYNYVHPIL